MSGAFPEQNTPFHQSQSYKAFDSKPHRLPFLGKELGGFRKGGYTAYIITEEFSNGVGMIESIAAENISVIICAEKFPWKCHRKWIARELQHRGWEIIHIIDKGKVWKPK
jgi:uncharacterized protein (DUF488 family)